MAGFFMMPSVVKLRVLLFSGVTNKKSWSAQHTVESSKVGDLTELTISFGGKDFYWLKELVYLCILLSIKNVDAYQKGFSRCPLTLESSKMRIFSRHRRVAIQAIDTSLKNTEVSKRLGQIWNKLPAKDKLHYLELAKSHKDEFQKKFPDYVYRRKLNNTGKRRSSTSQQKMKAPSNHQKLHRQGCNKLLKIHSNHVPHFSHQRAQTLCNSLCSSGNSSPKEAEEEHFYPSKTNRLLPGDQLGLSFPKPCGSIPHRVQAAHGKNCFLPPGSTIDRNAIGLGPGATEVQLPRLPLLKAPINISNQYKRLPTYHGGKKSSQKRPMSYPYLSKDHHYTPTLTTSYQVQPTVSPKTPKFYNQTRHVSGTAKSDYLLTSKTESVGFELSTSDDTHQVNHSHIESISAVINDYHQPSLMDSLRQFSLPYCERRDSREEVKTNEEDNSRITLSNFVNYDSDLDLTDKAESHEEDFAHNLIKNLPNKLDKHYGNQLKCLWGRSNIVHSSDQETLKTYYKPLYKNKVRVFSRKGKVIENHMIAKFISFDQMKEESKIGWQKLVAFLLHRQNFVTEVSKDNAALISGKMYAEGWRKAMVAEEIVGRYVNQAKLLRQMKEMNFNFEDEAEGFEFIGCFLSEQFRNVAPGSHQSCKEYLQQQSIPSITQVNHTSNTTYFPDDFCSAITYTMDDFSNKAHRNRDTDNWTLIGLLPIKKGGLIAEDGFDVEGGEFVIRDLKVFIDFSKVNGVVLLS
ncbi:hypothetical protein PPACK8108_LOCUS13694 [Phakopsora pachyrhizi]|uniref:HMG box domain-containing protein n=1 Tax=Phakopsora pachyrhizi TaxID=170000 RepID=A0AAV0B633_PHAPC|nr:hypothetical protein PPACK8108_LOCUS13694 [Phakopsora pachyrhizi]